MILPPILNYEENRIIKTGIKLNYKELMLSTFRLKRFLVAYYEFGYLITYFTSFKYPLFTTVFYIYSLLILLFYGVGFLFFTILLMFFLYY